MYAGSVIPKSFLNENGKYERVKKGEDRVHVLTTNFGGLLAGVTDGMGGYANSEKASELVGKTIVGHFKDLDIIPTKENVENHLAQAYQECLEAMEALKEKIPGKIGTTLATGVTYKNPEGQTLYSHLTKGDSVIAVLDKTTGGIRIINPIHNLYGNAEVKNEKDRKKSDEKLIDLANQAANHIPGTADESDVLEFFHGSQAITGIGGSNDKRGAYINTIRLGKDDVVLTFSDGISDQLTLQEIAYFAHKSYTETSQTPTPKEVIKRITDIAQSKTTLSDDEISELKTKSLESNIPFLKLAKEELIAKRMADLGQELHEDFIEDPATKLKISTSGGVISNDDISMTLTDVESFNKKTNRETNSESKKKEIKKIRQGEVKKLSSFFEKTQLTKIQKVMGDLSIFEITTAITAAIRENKAAIVDTTNTLSNNSSAKDIANAIINGHKFHMRSSAEALKTKQKFKEVISTNNKFSFQKELGILPSEILTIANNSANSKDLTNIVFYNRLGGNKNILFSTKTNVGAQNGFPDLMEAFDKNDSITVGIF